MRALILADIHSNFEALTAVMEDARARGGYDQIWCTGDVVGYGPDPSPCIDELRQQEFLCVVGNHDLAAAGRLSTDEFNTHAAQAIQWTVTQLGPDHNQFLSSLPKVVQCGEFTLVHGSLRMPIWEYLVSTDAAQATFQLLKTRYCLVGHSHIPFLCHERLPPYGFMHLPEGEAVQLGEERLIINPGGVGQPRDGDPRPSYALYDSDAETLLRYRVEYDIGLTQEKMRRAGLPEPLIHRLDFGR